MIVEYSTKYKEQVIELFVELQQFIADLDKEGYNILTEGYGEKYYKETLKEIKQKNGIMMLAIEDDKVLGLIVGIINNEEINEYDFKAPKRGRVTELIVSKKYRGKDTGTKLLKEMEHWFRIHKCKDVLIEVFAYNERGIDFYEKNSYHTRVVEMTKKI